MNSVILNFLTGKTLGGTVKGLSGNTLVLKNGDYSMQLTSSGSFSFPTRFQKGYNYNVTVAENPANPEHLCSVENAAGTINDSDRTDILVTCFRPAGTMDAVYKNISSGLFGKGAQSVIDTQNSKVLTVAREYSSNKLGLYQCSLDGSSCSFFNVSGSSSLDTGINVDYTNQKILITVRSSSNDPFLYRCDLNGTGCSVGIDLSTNAAAGISTGYKQFSRIELNTGKLITASTKYVLTTNDELYLFISSLDGTSSSFTNLSALLGTGVHSGVSPGLVFDYKNSKILIITQNTSNSDKPSLFRCDLNGTNCTHTDISAGQGTGSGTAPFALVDTINSKLLVITTNDANSGKPALFRCNLDGSSCTHTDISAGQGAGSGSELFGLIDSSSKKILAIARNDSNGSRISLFRCDLDGSNCTHKDISAGTAINTGADPTAVFDSISNRLLIFAEDVNHGLALFYN